MSNVLLINMPFAGVDRPPLGICNLKAALRARGIGCDIRNFNVAFAESIGPEFYQALSAYLSHTVLLGEWVFAQYLFAGRLPSAHAYFDYTRRERSVDPDLLARAPGLAALVPPFIEYCLGCVDWRRYPIVGFTSMFEQNMPSLALAYAIKRRFPHTTIVMGGANCEDAMGAGLHRAFPWIDYVVHGEADETFPALVESIASHTPAHGIDGITYRDGSRSVSTAPSRGVSRLDTIPFPDFRDYFVDIERTTIPWLIPQKLQMETSRGCWWGAKHHCTFCGLNPDTIHFRAKSKDRALAEIVHFAETYPVREIATVDNIIDMGYFRELIPELHRRNLGLQLFYETKANLTREQVRMLGEAGITWIQPGIESLNGRILTLMRKGITPLQNVQLLKWCKEYGLTASWNLLYGFPGESARDYQQMLPLLQALTHLQPPDATGKIRLDRFSPYFRSPAELGMVNVRPMEIYKFIYPVSASDLFDIAYFFDYDYADKLDPQSYIEPVERQIAHWRQQQELGAALSSVDLPDGTLAVSDSRSRPPRSYQLAGWKGEVYRFCDRVRSRHAIVRSLDGLACAESAPDVPLNALTRAEAPRPHPELSAFLDEMIASRLMAHDDDHFLSLAISGSSGASRLGAPMLA